MEYPKINSLWTRQGWYFEEGKKNNPEYKKGRQSFIIGDYACEEFGIIKKWMVDEKIDGTNIRINWKGGDNLPKFFGRTENAQIPTHLFSYLQDHFTVQRLNNAFPGKFPNGEEGIWIFGEGYGHKIQSGGNYRKDVGFILFDLKIGNWWIDRNYLEIMAKDLEVPITPFIDIMTEEEIVEFVKSKPFSRCSISPQVMEGVICRTYPQLTNRKGERVMFKLKCKEF